MGVVKCGGGVVEEPEALGVLAKIEILRNRSSVRNSHTTAHACLACLALQLVLYGRLGDPGGGGVSRCYTRGGSDGFWRASPLASTGLPRHLFSM